LYPDRLIHFAREVTIERARRPTRLALGVKGSFITGLAMKIGRALFKPPQSHRRNGFSDQTLITDHLHRTALA
jgi:hypothetical protein